MAVERTQLRPGYTISRVIKGGWQLAGGHGAVDRARAISDMSLFLDAGITTFDCADIYTGVEAMTGDFVTLSTQTPRADGHPISSIEIHTKLVPDLDTLATFSAADAEAIVDRSLRRLKVSCLDLVQFFWWDLTLGDPVGVMSSLDTLRTKGKVRHLGITNWDVSGIAPFVDAGVDVVSAQIQYSLLDHRPENGLGDWCARHRIALICYGVLAGGFLTQAWLSKPDPAFDFENRSLTKYRLMIEEFGGWDLFQSLLQRLDKVAKRHNVSIGAVATRYVLDRPHVAAAIVGARYADRLSDTLGVFEFGLDASDRAAIGSVLDQSNRSDGLVYALESDRAGRHGAIMKYNLNASAAD